MRRAALAHFKELTGTEYDVVTSSFNSLYPLYIFTTPFDPIVYKKNTNSYNSVEQYYTRNTTTKVYTHVDITDIDAFKTYDGSTDAKTLYVQKSGHVYAV